MLFFGALLAYKQKRVSVITSFKLGAYGQVIQSTTNVEIVKAVDAYGYDMTTMDQTLDYRTLLDFNTSRFHNSLA